MATIKEDYVSFEIAELLKEKGFEEECVYFYDWDEEDEIYRICSNGGSCNSKEYPTYYSMPTLQMTMKWLREIHHLVIQIELIDFLEHGEVWLYCITERKTIKILTDRDENFTEHSYEQACETAIKYCLENLI